MKKFFASVVFIIAFALYAIGQNRVVSPHASDSTPVTSLQADVQVPATIVATEQLPKTSISTTDNEGEESGSKPREDDVQEVAITKTSNKNSGTAIASVSNLIPSPVLTSKSSFVDGSYTGSSVNVHYGYVQVQAKISGGKLTDVTFLQYPNDRRTSLMISSQAMPLLIEEALRAQSAEVDGVSGASETSYGFRESLAVALSKARK